MQPVNNLNVGDFSVFWNISCVDLKEITQHIFVHVICWAHGTQRQLRQFNKLFLVEICMFLSFFFISFVQSLSVRYLSNHNDTATK